MVLVDFWLDARGRAPVQEYIDTLRSHGRVAEVAAIVRLLESLEEHGVALGMPYARIIDRPARLYELRPGPHRIAFALHHEKCLLIHAWRKTSEKLDTRARDLALTRLERLRRNS